MTNLGGAERPGAGLSLGAHPPGEGAAAFAVAVPAEHVIARLRRHGRMLFWPSLLLIIVAGTTSYFLGQLPEEWENIALGAGAALLVVFGFVMPFLSWLNRRYTITTRRVIVRHGFFVHVRQELLHSRGYDITMRRSWLQSAFRSGDILITAGSEHVIVLRDVPNAELVQSTLHELMERNQALVAAQHQQQQAQAIATDHTVAWGQR